MFIKCSVKITNYQGEKVKYLEEKFGSPKCGAKLAAAISRSPEIKKLADDDHFIHVEPLNKKQELEY